MNDQHPAILNKALVARALDRVRPALDIMLETALPGRSGFAIVVTAVDTINPWRAGGGTSFRDGCYLVTSVGDIEKSSYPNLDIAVKKAEISARSHLSSAVLSPHYLRGGDTVYHGSAVVEGIVVACAGLEPRDDEMLSYWIAAAVKSEASRAFAQYLAENKDANFLE